MALTEALETQLAGLNAEQLRALLIEMAGEDPGLVGRLERRLRALQSPPEPAPAAPMPAPDAAAIRREVRAALRESRGTGYYNDYGSASVAVAGVQEFLASAEAFLEAGQARDALAVLDAVTGEFLKGWEELLDYDEEGECGTFLGDLGALWTEAILSVDLAAGKRKSWVKRLREWQAEADSYADGSGLAAAALAAEQGWDYPPLVRVLQGEITPGGAWEGEAPRGANELAAVRLNILERQGRLEEYLHLAQAEGQTEQHLTMLVRLGRVRAAVDAGRATLTAPDHALVVAKALFEHGDREEALGIAEFGLKREPLSGVRGGEAASSRATGALLKEDEEEVETDSEAGDVERSWVGRRAATSVPAWHVESYARPAQKVELARWLRETATALGQPARALPAARLILETIPSLTDYQALQAVAGEEWPGVRAEVLDRLRKSQSYYREPEIDIFLAEGLIDEAIATLERGHLGHELVERVADAALASHPEWVMSASFHQADRIIEPGKASYYDEAAQWLRKARQAAIAAGQEDVWRARMKEIMAEHGRKHKLMALLKPLV